MIVNIPGCDGCMASEKKPFALFLESLSRMLLRRKALTELSAKLTSISKTFAPGEKSRNFLSWAKTKKAVIQISVEGFFLPPISPAARKGCFSRKERIDASVAHPEDSIMKGLTTIVCVCA